MGQFQILQDVPSRQSSGSSTHIINKSNNSGTSWRASVAKKPKHKKKNRNNIVTNSILLKNGPQVIKAHMCCAPGLFEVLISSPQHASEQILLFLPFTDEDTEA